MRFLERNQLGMLYGFFATTSTRTKALRTGFGWLVLSGRSIRRHRGCGEESQKAKTWSHDVAPRIPCASVGVMVAKETN
jgi:hypothetical protein